MSSTHPHSSRPSLPAATVDEFLTVSSEHHAVSTIPFLDGMLYVWTGEVTVGLGWNLGEQSSHPKALGFKPCCFMAG